MTRDEVEHLIRTAPKKALERALAKYGIGTNWATASKNDLVSWAINALNLRIREEFVDYLEDMILVCKVEAKVEKQKAAKRK